MLERIFRTRQLGFTLLELMIVIAIVSILATLAYPSYVRQVQQTRRADAVEALGDILNKQEQFAFTQSGLTYTNDITDLGYNNAAGNSRQGFYTITLAGNPVNNPTNYTATATPVGAQQQDTECYAYTINNNGVQGNMAADNTAIADSIATCWR